MGKKSKGEYLQEINGRYKKAGLEGKKKILDEFCNVWGLAERPEDYVHSSAPNYINGNVIYDGVIIY